MTRHYICKVCGVGGAHTFNSLCTRHWDEAIERNIIIVIEEIKTRNDLKKNPYAT